MNRILCRLAVSTAFVLIALAPASAGERPLIWEFSKSSDTSYSARVGSQLPTSRAASVGADIRMRGPDPRQFSDPVTFWGAVTLAEPRRAGHGRSTRLETRIDGAEGRRRVALNNTLKGRLPGLDAELRQDYAVDYEPAGAGRFRSSTTHSMRLSSPDAGTTLEMRASRTGEEEWRTSIGVEQPLRDSVKITGSVDDPARESRKARVRANYRVSW